MKFWYISKIKTLIPSVQLFKTYLELNVSPKIKMVCVHPQIFQEPGMGQEDRKIFWVWKIWKSWHLLTGITNQGFVETGFSFFEIVLYSRNIYLFLIIFLSADTKPSMLDRFLFKNYSFAGQICMPKYGTLYFKDSEVTAALTSSVSAKFRATLWNKVDTTGIVCFPLSILGILGFKGLWWRFLSHFIVLFFLIIINK